MSVYDKKAVKDRARESWMHGGPNGLEETISCRRLEK